MDRVPAVTMIGWHVARHWTAGDWGSLSPVYRNTTPAPKIQPAGRCGNINSVDQLRHTEI